MRKFSLTRNGVSQKSIVSLAFSKKLELVTFGMRRMMLVVCSTRARKWACYHSRNHSLIAHGLQRPIK